MGFMGLPHFTKLYTVLSRKIKLARLLDKINNTK
jgi:hypothetical protein